MAIAPALAWRVVSLLALAWLAWFFGRTLRSGQEALITRIASVSNPALPPALRRYTRRLTALWCAWFVLAALLSLAFGAAGAWAGPLVAAGSALLFIGEHWLRPRLLPGHAFPGLRQQVLDTLQVWRARP
jgi:uncharacterized membrane protein